VSSGGNEKTVSIKLYSFLCEDGSCGGIFGFFIFICVVTVDFDFGGSGGRP